VGEPEDDPELGTGAIAKMVRRNAKTVARWIDSGKLSPATKSPYGHRRCRLSVVEAFLRTLHMQEAT
jgi:hypothetical protein